MTKPWEQTCEIHGSPFELFEGEDDEPDYYECRECMRERAEALFDGPHYDKPKKELNQ